MTAAALTPRMATLVVGSYILLGIIIWTQIDHSLLSALGDSRLLTAVLMAAPIFALGVFVSGVRSAVVLNVNGGDAVDAVASVFLALALNTLLPFRMGDAVRLAFLKGRNQVPVIVGVSTTGIEKLADLAAVGLAAALAAAAGLFAAFDMKPAMSVLSFLVGAGVLAGLGAFLTWRAVRRIPRIAAMVGEARRLLRHVGELAFWRQGGGMIVGLTAAAWLLNYIGTFVFIVIAAPSLNAFAVSALLLVGANLAFALPITPGAVGVFQAVCVAILTTFGVSYDVALAQGVGLQVAMLGPPLLVLAPMAVRFAFSRRVDPSVSAEHGQKGSTP